MICLRSIPPLTTSKKRVQRGLDQHDLHIERSGGKGLSPSVGANGRLEMGVF